MNSRKTTNILLLIIVIPIVFYILQVLSFIFIPLFFAMFISLLFLPLMRKLNKIKIPKFLSLLLIAIILLFIIKLSGDIIQLSSKEILNSNGDLLQKIEIKANKLFLPIEKFFNIERVEDSSLFLHYFQKMDITKNFAFTFDFIRNTTSMFLTTIFFVFLLLAESLNMQKIMNLTIIRQKFSSIKVFLRIEKDLLKFMRVKFIISLFTGLGFTMLCYVFGISFPLFWGLLAFIINFIQMVGSIISVVFLSAFAFIELNTTGTLVFFISSIILVQVIMGGILEPVFLGKSFSINVIAILLMIMFWGFIWGIPGMILSIPITVLIKIIAEQFISTKLISKLLSNN